MQPNTDDIRKGQQIYNPLVLGLYNVFVLGFSCRFVWRCPTNHTVEFYSKHITDKHLDVGVGTGYLLDHCQFPSKKPQLGLLDMNENCLQHTARLLQRYQPVVYQADIYQPLDLVQQKYDSIGLNYVLHCLPGTFAEKSAVIKNLKACLSENGKLFGSTILAKDQEHNWLAKRLLTLYNKKGVFGNWHDDESGLIAMLKQHFANVDVRVKGTVAFFTASD